MNTALFSRISRLKRAARKVLMVAGAAAGLAFAGAASAQVSISAGQPGFYGQLNVGGYPPPVLYSPRPVVIERRYVGAPVYLRVPDGHRRNWSRNCYRYNACGRQVYFVQDSWYQNTYAPRYREHYRGRPVAGREHFYREPHRGDRHDNGNHYGQRDDRGDHGNHGNGRGHDRGPGRGEGRGHDRGDDRGHGR